MLYEESLLEAVLSGDDHARRIMIRNQVAYTLHEEYPEIPLHRILNLLEVEG